MVAEGIREILAGKEPVRLVSGDTHRAFRLPPKKGVTDLRLDMAGILSHDVADQVVSCRANTTLGELQTELARHGQCIPYLPIHLGGGTHLAAVPGSVAGHLAMNLPHSYEAVCGNWRDWLLGAKVLLPDGLEAKSGSKAVKNVAGYDVHKFLVGSRGVFCVFLEIILRTYPIKGLPQPDLDRKAGRMPEQGVICRTLPTEFAQAVAGGGDSLLATHPATSTLFLKGENPKRTQEGWRVGWGLGEQNLEPMKGPQLDFFRRAKLQFDPEGKLNPFEFREG